MNRKEFEQQIIERAWQDADFHAALKEDAAEAIEAEFGVEVPEGISIQVVEESADTQYLVIPASADGTDGELSDDDLDEVEGGVCWNTCGSTCQVTSVQM